MKFYDREHELQDLENIQQQSLQASRMIVLTGRRRAGKTSLALEFAKNKKYLYLFISKKSESLLCDEFIDQVKNIFPDMPLIGEVRFFKDIFNMLILMSKKEPFTLIIDEFQEFKTVNPSVFSDIQKIWDINKKDSKLNLIFIGSAYSLIHVIFQNSKEPLFNRADRMITIKSLKINTIAEILSDNKIKDPANLFHYYLFTGGSPRYIELLIENKAFTFDKIIDFMISSNSPFINEGKNLLIEEFGRDYGTYFSILELISSGKTSRPEIESVLQINTGGYIERLEKDYAVISRLKPVNSKPNSKKIKYYISDNFLNFWFRFIYKYKSAVELENFDYIKKIIRRDYSVYAGRILEQYFRDLLAGSKQYNRVGSYWENGNQNEIDIVAINDESKKILMAEVKLSLEKINIEELKRKSPGLLNDFKGYSVEYKGFSLDDVKFK